MRYIELFAGIGGFRYGIERALHQQVAKIEQNKSGRHRDADQKQSGILRGQSTTLDCVYSNEWDKYASSVYRKHYGECDDRDIRAVDAREIPDHDLLVGGFPCQAFSVAGKRGGLSDTRGTLFFEIARIAQEKRPHLLLLENVKGLLNHDQGRTFATILTALDELGYDVQWQMLNSKDFGVPQNRERVYIVANTRETPRPEVFPIFGSNNSATQKYVGSIGTPRKGVEDQAHLSRAHKQPARVFNPDGISPTLSSGETQGRYNIVQPVLTPDRVKKRQNGRRFKTDGEPAFTLTGQDIHGVYDGVAIRRLTPLECERLQGFPDNWTKVGIGNTPMSDTQRYKMCGNAVTTNVVTAIVERLI